MLYTHGIIIISKPLNNKKPGPRTREDIPSRTLENWFDEVAEADPGTRPPRRPEACNSLLLYMGKGGGNEGVGHNGKMLIMEEITDGSLSRPMLVFKGCLLFTSNPNEFNLRFISSVFNRTFQGKFLSEIMFPLGFDCQWLTVVGFFVPTPGSPFLLG